MSNQIFHTAKNFEDFDSLEPCPSHGTHDRLPHVLQVVQCYKSNFIMKRLKATDSIVSPKKMEKNYLQKIALYLIIVHSLVFCSILVGCLENGVRATNNFTRSNITRSSNFWKQGAISVIQGYPRRYHQGYNWTSSLSSSTSNLRKLAANISSENGKMPHDVPKAVMVPKPTVSTSVVDNWRPVVKNIKRYDNFKAEKRGSRINIVEKLHGSETHATYKNISTKSVKNNNESQNTSFSAIEGEGDEDSRKLKVVVPLHPKLAYFAKFLAGSLAPLFSVISLWNQKCWSAGFDQGTCYTRKGCLIRGGTPHGLCAGGFGVCCVFSYTCESSTPLNRTYFVNPEFPFSVSKTGTTCEHTITNLEGICQLRLDFEEFKLEGPNPTDGICWHDALHLFGVDVTLPPLCGDLTGHHLYIPVGFDPSVSYTLSLTGERPWRRWKIRTTKIPCGSGSIAPGGCLQYHHGPYGRVTSFNNNVEHNGVLKTNIFGLNYGVCVRKERGFCAIRWSKCSAHIPHYRHDTEDDDRKTRRRRDTGSLTNSRYLNIIGTEKQKQLDKAMKIKATDQLNSTAAAKRKDRTMELSQPRTLKVNTWKPLLSRSRSSFIKVVNSISEGKQTNKNQINTAVHDFLEDLTNALSIKGKSKQKVKGNAATGSASGSTSASFNTPVVSANKNSKYSISAGNKPIKLTALKNAFGQGKLPSKPSSFFGSGIKKKKPLKLKAPLKNKKPFWVKKKWNGKKKTKGKNKRRKKHRKKKGCSKILPFPLPIAVPFPFGGGGGGGGEGGGGGGDDGDGWGWSDDNFVFTTAMEPFLIRIMTDKWKENGLAPVCLEWEQISCENWYANENHGW